MGLKEFLKPRKLNIIIFVILIIISFLCMYIWSYGECSISSSCNTWYYVGIYYIIPILYVIASPLFWFGSWQGLNAIMWVSTILYWYILASLISYIIEYFRKPKPAPKPKK